MPALFRRPDFWMLLATVAAALGFLVFRLRATSVRVARVTRQDLEQHAIASGRVRVPVREQISAQVSGLVVAVGAIEGQHVKKGDLIVQIDDAATVAIKLRTRTSTLKLR